jgi:hypothetical protein
MIPNDLLIRNFDKMAQRRKGAKAQRRNGSMAQRLNGSTAQSQHNFYL